VKSVIGCPPWFQYPVPPPWSMNVGCVCVWNTLDANGLPETRPGLIVSGDPPWTGIV